jgi:hypothetical protein
MITCKGGKDIPGVMKVSHYLRYFERGKWQTKRQPRSSQKEPFREDHRSFNEVLQLSDIGRLVYE